MPLSLLPFRIALWMAAAPVSALPGVPAALPGGDSPVFREKMLTWSAPDEPPAPIIVRLPQTQARTSTRLPHLSSSFGYRNDPLRGGVRMHAGIDIPGHLGTPIQASASGIVQFAGNAGGYGEMVEIAHGNGLTTRYGHLSRILVAPGTPITRGETIGLMGSTGRSTGSHLHFEVRDHGQPTNPLAYLGGAALPEGGVAYTEWRAPSQPYVSQFARARAAAEPPAEK